jgi:hypothetical protein
VTSAERVGLRGRSTPALRKGDFHTGLEVECARHGVMPLQLSYVMVNVPLEANPWYP